MTEAVAAETSYADWGVGFFTDLLTVDRVLAGVSVLGGQPIELGPIGVGPRRVAKLRATGEIGAPVGDRTSLDPVTFRVALPVTLAFVIDLGVDKHRFESDLTVPLVITARARADLSITLDIDAPRAEDVVVRLRAQGVRASITQRAADVEGELKRFVARYVARELTKPYVVAARRIDVAAAVDRAIGSLEPRRPSAQAATPTDASLEEQVRGVGDALLTD